MNPTKENPFLEAALSYAARGWAVFPLHPESKIPLTTRGFYDGSKDPVQIKKWWEASPNANVAIVTGKMSDLIVVDIDGVYPLDFPPLEDSLSVQTKRGSHHYYQYPKSVDIPGKIRLRGEPVDIKSDGGYIVAPPSIHPDGGSYEWLHNDITSPLSPLQVSLISLILPEGNKELGDEIVKFYPRIPEETVLEMLAYLDPNMGYIEWVTIGMALHAGGYNVSLWENWSRKSPKFKKGECVKKWRSFHMGRKISMGSLIYMAKAKGYPGDISDYLKDFDNLCDQDQNLGITEFNGHFEPIIPFDQFKTPEIPTDLLPPVIGDFVQNVSDLLSVPTAMPVMAALGMISTAVAKKFLISPKKDWLEPINIYTMTAMLPASNKSQTLKFLKSPIDEWEKEEASRLLPLIEASILDISLLETELKKHHAVVSDKKSKAEDIERAKELAKDVGTKISEKEKNKPVQPQLYVTDATPEAIADLVYQQGNRLGIISDEGGITEVMAGLYNNGHANIDIFLKGIDGGTTRIKRANKDYTLNPYLSVTLLVQPQVLCNMASKRAFSGNGALERYLYALPVCPVGYRTLAEVEIDLFIKSDYDNTIKSLLSIPTPEKPYILRLSPDAQSSFNAFWQEIEQQLRPDGKLHMCMGWGGKLAGYTLRLAGLMHMAKYGDICDLTIENDTLKNAISLARLLMEHAVAVYGLMGTDQETQDTKELLEWVKTRTSSHLTKSDITLAMRNRHMGKKERLAKAITGLVDRNIFSSAHFDYKTKKPTEIYFINPEIYESSDQKL